MRKGILYTPYRLEDIRQHILDRGFEVVSESVSGNCYEVRARKPLGDPQRPVTNKNPGNG